MEIILNNNPDVIETAEDSITVENLLRIKKFSYKLLVVKINDILIKKEDYPISRVVKGDNVQVIHLITGG
ncbi:hypothetical protein CYCD_07480 [Tenuifilaceae bacterium CYCD]|nr:hypothetical protein CYCD_07480 [Tenuifilaceae bacterium CYCD]